MKTREEIEAKINILKAEIESHEIGKGIAAKKGLEDKVSAYNSLIDKTEKSMYQLEWVLDYELSTTATGSDLDRML